jgi:hypothetical protein
LDTKLKVDRSPANNLAGRTRPKGRNNNLPHLTIASLALASLALLQAATQPTPTDLSEALTEAWMSWGVQSNQTIQLRLDPLNSCVLTEIPTIAQTQSLDTVTTMRFDDGSEPEVSHHVVWVIRINSNCNWSKLNLINTITHELGHILISPNFHSKNEKSIMFWIVRKNQSVLPEDKAMLKREAVNAGHIRLLP